MSQLLASQWAQQVRRPRLPSCFPSFLPSCTATQGHVSGRLRNGTCPHRAPRQRRRLTGSCAARGAMRGLLSLAVTASTGHGHSHPLALSRGPLPISQVKAPRLSAQMKSQCQSLFHGVEFSRALPFHLHSVLPRAPSEIGQIGGAQMERGAWTETGSWWHV